MIRAIGLPVKGFASSGLPGPKGNRETFVWSGGSGSQPDDLEAAILRVEPDGDEDGRADHPRPSPRQRPMLLRWRWRLLEIPDGVL